MSVYFALRSHYEGPSGRFCRRFEDESVLAWFQRHWQGAAGSAANDLAQSVLGTDVYGFGSLFQAIGEQDAAAPRSGRELRALLEEHLYVEGEILHSPHALQVLTDDDELELAYYFFDDAYLERHGAKAAFLLHDGWRLPEAAGDAGLRASVRTHRLASKRKGEGATYLAFLAYYDSGNLSDLEGAGRIDGVRLPELAEFLAGARPGEEWPFELRLLRSHLSPESGEAGMDAALRRIGCLPFERLSEDLESAELDASPEEARRCIDRFLQEQDLRTTEEGASKSLVQVAPHVAQLSLHTGTWGERELFHRWVLFDDLWLAAQPDLGNAVLRHAARWDVLS
jgi:hypothetical protein